MVLGDNIFYGAGFKNLLDRAVSTVSNDKKAVVFGYYVDDPHRYGVAEFDQDKNVISIEEKPADPKSNYAVVGLYFYPNSVVDIAKNVKPSARNELEITSVNQTYLEQDELKMEILSRGYAWLDTGTHEAMSDATEFVKAVEKRTALKIGCIEEIAYRMGYIDESDLNELIRQLGKSDYSTYLKSII
jgi:glucose-1-phosphate thymidylyltransferase